ncbi:Peptidase M23 [Crinalium epipsammum PCC 9333]|uniref:Peptidase M23 n=1 Tax=Crinalium epipsammum PCC 9333 TaxID=1173022 RepID=K9VV60_9CYAN|nr:M23 family metallopeptidase [Crinalium epipsammum]AFZ11030.1 Peptidase M23 [Crinalium epipsammum PCC 9333]
MGVPQIFFSSKKNTKVRIGEVFLKKGLITQAQLEEVLAAQRDSGKKVGDILIQKGLITRKQLDQALTSQYWQNLSASIFLSLGAVTTALPQVAVAQVAPAPRIEEHDQLVKAEQHEKSYLIAEGFVQGSSLSYAAPTSKARGSSSNPDLVSLKSNQNPSAANPLQGFIHPLGKNAPISQGHNGTTHQGRMAYAIDLDVPIGTAVYAMRSGKVVRLEERFADTGGGEDKKSKMNFVLIEHDGGYRSAYLHLKQGFASSVKINVGDRVKAGDLIGYTGNSGWSTGAHLHVEVHQAGEYLTFGQSVPFVFNGASQSGNVAVHQH